MARYSKEIQEISKETKIKQATLHKIKLFYEENKKWYTYFCENPYKTMDIEGFGFKRCDELARKINFDMMSDFRVVACVKHVVEDSASGNTIVEFKKAMEGVIKLLERKDTGRMRKAIIESANKCGYLMYTRDLKRTDGEDVYFITLEWWKETEQDIFKLCKKADLFENKSEEEINNAIEEVEKKLEFPLNERQRKAFMEIPHGKVNVLSGVGGCLPVGTEVLTKNGWINIEDWNGQEIMEVYAEDKLGVTGRFMKPIKFHKYKTDQFYRMKGNSVDLIVSENHNNLIVSEKGFYKKKTTEEIYIKWNEKTKYIKEKGIKSTNFINIPETFEWFGEGINYTDDYIRLKIAIFADGYFGYKAKSKPNMCHINIKKEKKQKRLELLLEKNNIKYTIQKGAEGYKRYYFEADNDKKIIESQWFFETNKHQREVIMEEIMMWDGSFGKGERIGNFYSIEKETIDTVQLIAHSLGYRATIGVDTRGFEKYTKGVCYSLNFSKNKNKAKVFECSRVNTFKKVEAGKFMFCFTTSTGNFLIRQNGKVYATGNSGKSYTTRAILDVFDKLGESYTCLAPTGCATKVLMNSTKRDAYTIHRKYYADYKMRQEKIYTDWLVIDEMSMLSLEHFRLINNMLHEAPTKLLLIGDINQLQPISVGNPFFDIIKLIESGMIKGNVIHLTEIMRSKKDSAISHICKMFTEHGEYSKAELYKEHKGVEFIPLDKKDFTKQIGAIIKSRDFKLNETFVLSPFNVKEFGTNIINNYIQRTFSKGEVVYEDKYKKYKIGDYLMHTKNNSNLGIFNGERIRLVSDLGMRFDDSGNEVQMYLCQKVDEPLVYIEYTDKLLMTQTMLAYAISIHKSQGSSLVNTIVVLDSSHYFSLSRNSVYTGMSRASKNLVVLYDEKALEYASSRNEVERRKTFLREFYNLQMKKREEKGE